MSKIAIVGAGRIGSACAKILHHIGEADVTLIDNSEEALAALVGFDTRLAQSPEQLEAVLLDAAPSIVLCSTPF